ncbi:MAG: hypothetical protein L0215_04765 [Gemmataceae bacterium]|nr:hypothetical protein [Gemmataceae bacterium]
MTSMVKKIDKRMQAAVGTTPRQLGAYVLFMNNQGGLDQRLRDLAAKEAIGRVALGIGVPPPDYEVNNEADVTVVVYKPARRGQQHVTANFALRKGELNDAKADDIVKAIADVLPPPPPVVHTVVAHSREKEQQWRYTFAKPADHWYKPDFNDLSWKSGPGGFGIAGTPGAVVRTVWNTNAIWLRREIILPDGPFTHFHLQLHHDDDTEVYLNGVLAAKLPGYTTGYREVPISEEARKTLRPGANVLAVYCWQTGGGQYIDVGLVEVKK